MCFNELLCQTNDGQVHLSCCGKYYRLLFNNIVILNNETDFMYFYNSVDECYQQIKNDPNPNNRSIVFATQMANLKLQFSPLEIGQLHFLIESSIIKSHTNV
jgi:hypothetical protein